MKIKLSKSQWEQIGKTAGWAFDETLIGDEYEAKINPNDPSPGKYSYHVGKIGDKNSLCGLNNLGVTRAIGDLGGITCEKCKEIYLRVNK